MCQVFWDCTIVYGLFHTNILEILEKFMDYSISSIYI